MHRGPSGNASLAHAAPSARATPGIAPRHRAVEMLWRLHCVALLVLTVVIGAMTAVKPTCARPGRGLAVLMGPVVELAGLDRSNGTRPEPSHGLRHGGAPREVDLDAVEIDDDEDDKHSICCIGEGTSLAMGRMAARRSGNPAWRRDAARDPSLLTGSSGLPRGPPAHT